MLRRLALRDFVIVEALEVEPGPGFSVLTGETGAGKSILVDALQLALGSRGDAAVVREGAPRAEIAAEFDVPPSLAPWLAEAGFEAAAGEPLLLRRTLDTQGRSRAWINGSPATIAQLREAADHLVEIHGQHAWQSLTRPPAVRALLDDEAGVDAAGMAAAWSAWRAAQEALERALRQQSELARERERLAFQIRELEQLGPGRDEWAELNAEHERLSHLGALIEAARLALEAIDEADRNASTLAGQAAESLAQASRHDARLAPVAELIAGAQAQLQDAAHTLASYLHQAELDPQRLAELDERLSAWLALARRYRRPPADLPALLEGWQAELRALDAASDAETLEAEERRARQAYDALARAASQARRAAAPKLAQAITQALQGLGMKGARFEVALPAQHAPQSFGLESVELLVAGHEGATPRPLARVASGGELSRIALAVAVTTSSRARDRGPATLIFDEIDAGVGGAVAETVGRLMQRLGRECQVLAVTHLPQVAACADAHWLVAKRSEGGRTTSRLSALAGEARVAEIARMLGGERLSGTSLAHAQEMLASGETAAAAASPSPARPAAPRAASRRRQA